MVEVHNQAEKQTSERPFDSGYNNLLSDNDMSNFNKIMGRDNKPAAAGSNGLLEFNNIYKSDTNISKQQVGAENSNQNGAPNKAGSDTSERKGPPNKAAGDTIDRKDGTFDSSKPKVPVDGGLKDKFVGKPNPAADGGVKDKFEGNKPNDAADGGLKDKFVGKPNPVADGGVKDKFEGNKPNVPADGGPKTKLIDKPDPAADGGVKDKLEGNQSNHSVDNIGKEHHKLEGLKNGEPKENFNPPSDGAIKEKFNPAASGEDNPVSKSDASGKELEFKSFRESSASITDNHGNVTLASAQPLTQPWTVHGDGTVSRGTTKSQPVKS